ncbi:MAG: HAD family phosphatase [Pseudomonadota bacterium]
MVQSVIFDIGNVLVDWSVGAFLKANGFSADEANRLVSDTLSLEWHGRADLGLSIAENVRQRQEERPEDARALTLYAERWQETVVGPIEGSVTLLQQLHGAGFPLFAITNFPADQFPAFCARFDFMRVFKSIVVSGDVGLKKPDPRIYALALDRFGCRAEDALFIDDRRENCRAAAAFGMNTHVFNGPACLAKDLQKRGLLPA